MTNETRLSTTEPAPYAVTCDLLAVLAYVLRNAPGFAVGHYMLDCGQSKLRIATASIEAHYAVAELVSASGLRLY